MYETHIMCISSLKAQSWRVKSGAFNIVADGSVAFDSSKHSDDLEEGYEKMLALMPGWSDQWG